MKVRGRRRCAECDARWSYFETGSPQCPTCGSLRSVAVDDEPSLHTDAPATLDLGPARASLDDRPLPEVAATAASAAREYLAARGFVEGGELLGLDGTVLLAAELRHVGSRLRRALAVDEAAGAYFLELLAGERPDDVPAALRSARGLASADAVGAYRRDLRAYLDEHPRPDVRPLLDDLRAHERRVAALDGDVPPREADALVAATRELGNYLRSGDETALVRAADRLERLG